MDEFDPFVYRAVSAIVEELLPGGSCYSSFSSARRGMKRLHESLSFYGYRSHFSHAQIFVEGVSLKIVRV